MNPSSFIISLDFELHWGVFDHTRLDGRGRRYFDVTRELIPVTLERFRQNGIRATWATVGMLFAHGRADLEAYLPAERPAYADNSLDPYQLLDRLGKDEKEDPYHFAPSLIEQIASTPGQCIGSHTFSHFYCLEPGGSATSFAADLRAARHIAQENFGIDLRSLVFPRNQCAYLEVVRQSGFTTFRGNPAPWFWRASGGRDTSTIQKATRLVDHYVPVTLSQAATMERERGDVPASRFLRPCIQSIDRFGAQRLKVRRIVREMRAAARRGQDYHLWWHPHNLATEPSRNLAALDTILAEYRSLHRSHGMQSACMEDMSHE